MPDAALAGPAGTASAFVYITFLPSPFGPGYTAGIVAGREITIPSMDGRWHLLPSGGRCAGAGPGLQILLSAMAQNRG